MSAGKRRKVAVHSPSSKVKAGASRPLRTSGQAGAAYAAAELLDSFVDLDGGQVALVAAVLTGLFSWAQVLIENYLGGGLGRDAATEVIATDLGIEPVEVTL